MRSAILWTTGLLIALALGAGVFVLRVATYASTDRDVGNVLLEVPPGTTTATLIGLLETSGLAEWHMGNTLAVRWYGGEQAIKTGFYRFTGKVSLRKILDDLAHGRIDLVTVTFPEGLTVKEYGALLTKAGVTDGNRFTALALSQEGAKKWGLPGPTLEGYLFPDTYKFARKLPPEAVIETLVARFRKITTQLSPEQRAGGLALNQWVTLASIVEKETGSAPERPVIASVFHNRLKKGMLLQTDPTVIYGIPNFDGNIRRADLKRDTPYNTYTRKGLPPGPIANPGKASLEAVQKPAETGYYYFVSKNDGTHHFSRTLAEHEAAVKKYQLGQK